MRPATWGLIAAGALAIAAEVMHGRFRIVDSFDGPLPPDVPMLARTIGADTIATREPSFGVIAYRVPLPPATSTGGCVELQFREPLDGARVEAFADGPLMHAPVLRRRIGGDTVFVPLPLGTVEAVDVQVHRHLRPPPIVRDIALLTPATAGPAGDPPPAASPQSMR